MEKSKTKIIIMVVVMMASLASYVFLNHAQATQATSQHLEQYDENMDEEGNPADSKLLLPDVQMVKKVLETGRRLLPVSQ